ncbi:hypothetical protein [Bradyrhizobium sp. G127]|jgi:hypothetical protein|uniref:hypothetical protein n=1 Tax=Bradyrhizobium sp. G127 TaxID=2904800 RepID=UPI001BBFA77D|nr:hypothetical protein [Bradyrhizobium sp. G127]MBS4004965.1 hypothetical protein [Afipia sp.]MCF2521638.1 hypothetical protein [Bradyrhizobium sp. G127]
MISGFCGLTAGGGRGVVGGETSLCCGTNCMGGASDGAGGAGDGKGATPLTGGSGADVTVGGREDVAGAMVEGSVEVDGDAPGAEGAAALGVCFALSAGGGV